MSCLVSDFSSFLKRPDMHADLLNRENAISFGLHAGDISNFLPTRMLYVYDITCFPNKICDFGRFPLVCACFS